MNNELLLLSGEDIPFLEAQVTIHPPTLKEISYIGEKTFFVGCGFLNFSKDMLNNMDKTKLSNYDDFEILMSLIINGKDAVKETADAAMKVLFLIFPLYEISVRKDPVAIILTREQKQYEINKNNFIAFKKIIIDMFNLKELDSLKEYNPEGDMAQRIAEKFKLRHKQLKQLKEELNMENGVSVLSRYASILAVGLQKDLNSLMHYTVYQLYDEFQRFQLKVQWDAYIQARMAGAKNLDEVDNWMIDLKKQGKQNNKK